MSIKIICADSLKWLPVHRNQGSIICSVALPDASEFRMKADLDSYTKWFQSCARECFLSVSDNCPVIFSQTDRKKNGRWLDKAHILHSVADDLGFFLVWHKIELRRAVGKMDLMRPGYRHLLAFGKGKVTSGKATADVIPVSKELYSNAFGITAATIAVKFCLTYNKRILDPFCGQGTVVLVADQLGADATGVDIDPKQCELAKKNTILLPSEPLLKIKQRRNANV